MASGGNHNGGFRYKMPLKIPEGWEVVRERRGIITLQPIKEWGNSK